jgi:hypothetical protein
MKFGNSIRAAVGAMALAFLASAAHSAPAYYFGKDDTNGAPGGASSIGAETLFGTDVLVTSTENFGTALAPPNTQLPEYLYLSGGTRSTAVGTLSQAADPPSSSWGQSYLGASVMSGEKREGRYNTTGNAASGRWLESDVSFTLTLANPVQAFAFFGTDFGDFSGSLVVELFADGGIDPLVFDGAAQVTPGGPRTNVFAQGGNPIQPRVESDTEATATRAQDGSLLFFGFASDTTFNRIRFTLNQGPDTGFADWDYLGFDDIRIGNLRTTTPPNPAPEPGSLALAGLALFAAGWARKTQRRA